MTYQELEDQFYLSNSSLKRLLAKLRGALKVYGLNIKSNPFMIIGDERLIRNFYTQYFRESYSHTEWPFIGVNQELLEKTFERLLTYYGINKNHFEYSHLRFQFGVDMIRAYHGHFIEEFFDEGVETRQRQFQTYSTALQDVVRKYHLSSAELALYFSQLVNWKFFSLPFLKQRIAANPELGLRLFKYTWQRQDVRIAGIDG